MRVLYFNDQTEEFYDTPKDIYFLGSLYLKGKPYTNPKEAVDKEYVDNAFDNITSDNITEKIPASAYPAFGGDLTNKAKTNNFTLKDVGKAGRYHKPTFDSAGRITGGKTGKLTLNKNDISGIDFGKIEFLPKEDWDSINDWTKGFDRTKYLMLDDKTINFAKPVSINEPKIINENMVINEDQVMKVSEEFFTGKLGTLRRNGVEDLNNIVEDIYRYNHMGGFPWSLQADYVPYQESPIDFSKDPTHFIFDNGQHYQLSYIYKNYIYVISPELNDKRSYGRFTFDENGTPIKDSFEEIVANIPNFPGIEDTVQESNFYMIGDKLLMTFYTRESGRTPWYNLYYSINPDGSLGELTDANKFTAVWFNQFTYYQLGTLYRIYSYDNSSYCRTYRTDKLLSRPSDAGLLHRLPGEVNFPNQGKDTASLYFFNLGPYLYTNFGYGEMETNELSVKTIKRIQTTNGVPFGEWEFITLDKPIPKGQVLVANIKGKIILAIKELKLSRRWHLTFVYIDFDKHGDLGKVEIIETPHRIDGTLRTLLLTENKLHMHTLNSIYSFDFKGSPAYDYDGIKNESTLFDDPNYDEDRK